MEKINLKKANSLITYGKVKFNQLKRIIEKNIFNSISFLRIMAHFLQKTEAKILTFFLLFFIFWKRKNISKIWKISDNKTKILSFSEFVFCFFLFLFSFDYILGILTEKTLNLKGLFKILKKRKVSSIVNKKDKIYFYFKSNGLIRAKGEFHNMKKDRIFRFTCSFPREYLKEILNSFENTEINLYFKSGFFSQTIKNLFSLLILYVAISLIFEKNDLINIKIYSKNSESYRDYEYLREKYNSSYPDFPQI